MQVQSRHEKGNEWYGTLCHFQNAPCACHGHDHCGQGVTDSVKLQVYTESTDGSYLDIKESALVWHYKDADPDFGRWQAKVCYIA